MKYLCSVPVVLLLVVVDVALVASIIGLLLFLDAGEGPYSFQFAAKVWG